jgi:hypothetical protein
VTERAPAFLYLDGFGYAQRFGTADIDHDIKGICSKKGVGPKGSVLMRLLPQSIEPLTHGFLLLFLLLI